mmetsp:Transcript_38897/g.111758  ORF Transcript_38897/g.111758 Transcript_38897/m.111758 type:complete len:270 (+) Transcript_38897:2027-2836(+)
MSVITLTSFAMAAKLTWVMGFAAGFPSRLRLSCCARSIMFATMSNKRAVQPFTIPNCLCNAELASDCIIAPVKPMIPCKGLRISWDNIAIRAAFFSCVILSSAMSERSWPMATTPANSPSCVDFGTSVIANCRDLASDCCATSLAMGIASSTKFPEPMVEDAMTKSSVLLPCRALSTTLAMHCSMLSTHSLSATFTSRLPRTSSSLMPVKLARFAFQSMMRPSKSMANTGMRALCIKASRSLLAASAAAHQLRMMSKSWRFRIIAKIAP